MQEKAHTKMITSARNKVVKTPLSARDSYILKKIERGFTPTEIITLLERDGFTPVARSRIYQIVDRENAKKH